MKQFLFIFLFIVQSVTASSQMVDSIPYAETDSSVVKPITVVISPLQKLLQQNSYFNKLPMAVSLAVKAKQRGSDNFIFYILGGLIFLFGIFKTIYSRYYSTLFRVFFNSSLRQSQLTDQLMQAKLPSLFFNLIFVMSAGFYVYLLLKRLNENNAAIRWDILGIAVLACTVIYFIKFISIKFIGWITGYTIEADTYIFIVFLINKIIGICLLPVLVILAFSDINIINVVIAISLVVVGVMLLFRFIRSFSLLQHKLKISRFHFLLYIFSLEILPVLLIYKAVELFINKNL